MRGFDPVSHERRVLVALGLAVTLAVVLAPVVAASTLTYAISGVESGVAPIGGLVTHLRRAGVPGDCGGQGMTERKASCRRAGYADVPTG
jgi:hypothetical protein